MSYYLKDVYNKIFNYKNQNPVKDNFTFNREGYVTKEDNNLIKNIDQKLLEELKNKKIDINFLDYMILHYFDFFENKFQYTPKISCAGEGKTINEQYGITMICNNSSDSFDLKLSKQNFIKSINLKKNTTIFIDNKLFPKITSEKTFVYFCYSCVGNYLNEISIPNKKYIFNKSFYEKLI